MSGADLPPPYYALKEDASTEQTKSTEHVGDTKVPISGSYDDAPEVSEASSFEDKDTRIGFIQKILTIKLLQSIPVTIFTILVAMAPAFYRPLYVNRDTHITSIVVSSLIFAATLVMLHYCNEARFVTPYNYLFLVAYPLATAVFISLVTFRCGLLEVLMSSVLFNLILLALLIYTVFAMQTKIEFKTNNALLVTGGVLFVFYTFMVSLIYGISIFGLLYCSLALFGMTAYILLDLEAMMSETYRIRLSPSDVVKAALILHIDYRYMIAKLFKNIARGRSSNVYSAENPNCRSTENDRPYNTLKEDGSTEQNAAEAPILDSYDDAPEVYEAPFEDKDVRLGFIQKILAIKMLQDIAVTLVMVIFVADTPVYKAMTNDRYTHINLTVVSLLILSAALFLLRVCIRERFLTPYNYLCLVVYPLATGLFVTVLTFQWGLVEIFVSWVHFNFVMFALLMYSIAAMHTKHEFNTRTSLSIAGGILSVAYFFTVPFVSGITLFSVQCSLVMFALTAYVVKDLQVMMSKTYRFRLSPSDVGKAALIMHIDYRYLIVQFYNRNYKDRVDKFVGGLQ